MRRATTATVFLVLATLLTAPLAWGCEASEASRCGMTDCPMSADHDLAGADETQGCHQEDAERADCDPRAGFSAGCCEISDGTQEAEAATRNQATRNETRPALIGYLAVERPPELPVDATRVLRSQQHELGRFALLASFLL